VRKALQDNLDAVVDIDVSRGYEPALNHTASAAALPCGKLTRIKSLN
jgi:hypothetical protein